jgi:uncharacterized protein YbbC (DUF1343 family)
MKQLKRNLSNNPIGILLALLLAFSSSAFPNVDQLPEYWEVQVGADRLLSECSHLINGKRLALVSNHSGRLSDGTHLADALFRYKDAKLKVLFGMEFNIRSNDYSIPRDQEKDIDKETGLVKYSLYGDNHKPTPEMLRDIDAIVFDIQDVGARFYEHVNILGFVMEAAAENNIEVIVLDRPNPLTGLKQDGFLPDDEFLHRFGSFGRIPVLHGMTVGEIARMCNGEKMLRGGLTAKLHVVEMKGWKRSFWFDGTGLQWRKPSPNLLTLSSVIAYTGTCLFEGLNISEGRGTDRPFEYVGAPWIDHHKAAELLNGLGLDGVLFEPVEFIPEKKPHLSREPELSGQRCKGIYIHVIDREKVNPYRAGVALVWIIHELHADKMVWDENVIERLTATKRFMKMIRAGKRPEEIFESWRDEVDQFKDMSGKYLIYQ